MQVQIKLLNPDCMPYKKYPGDAGFDLRANIGEEVILLPWTTKKIPTGVCVEIPSGHYGDIRGRSGLAARGIVCHGGTVDSGYTGEIQVVLANMSCNLCLIRPGERIAQLVIAPLPGVELVPVDELEGGDRGDKGFGSTGRV